MSRKSVVQRNLKRITMVARYRKSRGDLVLEIKKRGLPADEKFILSQKLASMPRDASWIRVRRRCAKTGRGRGVYRRFGFSRIFLRYLILTGQLPGVVKLSW